MAIAALVIGVLILAQGILGLVSPELFSDFVAAFQVSPVIYFAAIIRVLVGVILFRAAPVSRAPHLLRGLGTLIAIGGLLTPFVGPQFAKVVFGWWSEGGAPVVRMWAGASFMIGAFIMYATIPGTSARGARLNG
jgi:hypothetical protein